jgi:Cytidine and deoxycytidylate deaminase zinc-binding region
MLRGGVRAGRAAVAVAAVGSQRAASHVVPRGVVESVSASRLSAGASPGGAVLAGTAAGVFNAPPARALTAEAVETPGRLSDKELQPLLEQAIAAKGNSYSPYSKFRVGAVVRTTDGTVFKGCNVENASYGLTICAERTALTKAVSEGHQTFTTIVVAT